MNTPYALGRIPSPPDDRDHTFAMYAAVTTVPPKYISPILPPVLDQQKTPQCVAYSYSAGAEIAEVRDSGRPTNFDQADFFRLAHGGPNGANMRDAADAGVKTGILATSDRIVVGERLKIAAYARLYGLPQIKDAILAGNGAWLGVTWLNPWFKPLPSGMLPKADPKDMAGGHALWVLGYDDTIACPDGTFGAFYVQNSWGVGFAKGGRFWMPYSYLGASPEAWALFDAKDCQISVTPFTPGRTWTVAAGHTVNGWSLKTPNAPVKTQRWTRASGAPCDAEITVTWPGLTPTPGLNGIFYRTTGGAYSGQWVRSSEVTLK